MTKTNDPAPAGGLTDEEAQAAFLTAYTPHSMGWDYAKHAVTQFSLGIMAVAAVAYQRGIDDAAEAANACGD